MTFNCWEQYATGRCRSTRPPRCSSDERPSQARDVNELMMKSVGTTENVSPVIVEAFRRAAIDLTPEQRALALKCWKASVCETGHGTLTVAYADGFGENVWRQVTKMEFIAQALTYPEHQKDRLHLGRWRRRQGGLRHAGLHRAESRRDRHLCRCGSRAPADGEGSHRGRHPGRRS